MPTPIRNSGSSLATHFSIITGPCTRMTRSQWVTTAMPISCRRPRSEEHTSELQSLMRISYAVFCLKKKTTHKTTNQKKSSITTNINNNKKSRLDQHKHTHNKPET